MIKYLLIILVALFSLGLEAQVPNQFKYQGALRNQSGELLVNSNVNIRISILEGSMTNNFVTYEETHSIVTNGVGLFSLSIGSGTDVEGDISDISWGDNTFFLQVEADDNLNGNYEILGVTQLLSVPYALHAQTVSEDRFQDADSDPTNEIQNLTLDGNTLRISNGNEVTLPTPEPDTSNNEVSTIWTETNQGIYYDSSKVSIGTNRFFSAVSLTVKGNVFLPDEEEDSQIFFGPNSPLTGYPFLDFTSSPPSFPSLSMGLDENFQNGFLSIKSPRNNTWLELSGNSNNTAGYLGLRGGENQDLVRLTTSTIDTSGVIVTFNYGGRVSTYLGGNTSNRGGLLDIYSSSGRAVVRASSFDDQRGFVDIYSPTNGERRAILSSEQLGGFYESYNNLNTRIASIGPDISSSGNLTLFRNNGNPNIALGSSNTESDQGIIEVYGANGSRNTTIGAPLGNASSGYVAIFGADDIERAGLFIDVEGDGIVFGDMKSFRDEHPNDPNKEIWYVSLEGPEAAVYQRGTAMLTDGLTEISFLDHFSGIIDPTSITVTLTPLSSDSKGLAVVNKSETGFTVEELFSGQGNYEFDWEVKAVRKKFKDHQVVRDKKLRPISPSPTATPPTRPIIKTPKVNSAPSPAREEVPKEPE